MSKIRDIFKLLERAGIVLYVLRCAIGSSVVVERHLVLVALLRSAVWIV